MKKLLAWVVMMGASYLVFGQDAELDQQDPKVREKIQAARIALISEKVKLTPALAEKFWPIYREFAE
ncbi:MAG: hypothetical protein ACK5R0_03145, partial [Bacteroidota bacterium]